MKGRERLKRCKERRERRRSRKQNTPVCPDIIMVNGCCRIIVFSPGAPCGALGAPCGAIGAPRAADGRGVPRRILHYMYMNCFRQLKGKKQLPDPRALICGDTIRARRRSNGKTSIARRLNTYAAVFNYNEDNQSGDLYDDLQILEQQNDEKSTEIKSHGSHSDWAPNQQPTPDPRPTMDSRPASANGENSPIVGSDIINFSNIDINFVPLLGLARRVVAHTCSVTLDLPTTYISYNEFSNELQQQLNSAFEEMGFA
ncbi:hypothetical protein MAR_017916 [Mya arenaria]|uniref:Uncharacterized protein n=1 Tax=Mya arenaria TaxID=6604 RepID=A0ABY7EH21_MYAAR|nr:hypothetical protein MAR_017916 [Mya arenaria]